MKRLLMIIFLMSFMMSGTAFAAEKEISLLVDGVEKELQYPIWQKEEKVLISVVDFADIVKAELEDTGGGHIHLKVGKQEENNIWVDEEYEFWIAKNKKDCWSGMLQAEKGRDDRWYIPLRAAAEQVDWAVSWKMAEGKKTILLESPVMPKLTMTAEYDREKNCVSAFLRNGEQQAFTGYYDIFLQKKNGENWESVPMRKEPVLDNMIMIISGNWMSEGGRERYSMDAFAGKLPEGRYRLCVPVSFSRLRPPAEKPNFDGMTAEQILLYQGERHYDIINSNPPFFAHPVQEGERRDTNYIVAGEFFVK
ncbi:hypothetical protein [Anaerotignum sp.]